MNSAKLIRSSTTRSFALLAAISLCIAWFGWACRTDPSIPFLSQSGAESWIVYPKPPDANPHRAAALPAEFRHVFTLAAPGSSATISARAFGQGILLINGHPALSLADPDWKKPRTADVTALLQTGTNTILVTVSNRFGPPALALSLQLDGQLVAVTGVPNQWEASLAGAVWAPAVLATTPPAIRPGNDLYGRPSILESLRRAWPKLLVLIVISALVLLGFHRLMTSHMLPHPNLLRGLADPAVAALTFALLAWVLLFANNLVQIAPLFGFDRDGHTEYINFILEKGALPLATDGWQMYQPPLYYLISAALLFPIDLSASSDAAIIILRAFSGVIGLVHILLLFLSFRLLFPGQPSKQALGILLGAFLPAHLYVSHHVTNETLAACLSTAAIYFALRVMRAAGPTARLSVAAGAFLGLALLTKFSAVLIVPFVIFALCWRGAVPQPGQESVRLNIRNSLLALTALLVVCGWHYARVWHHFGNPLIGNWDPSLPFAWWQEPGYRTGAWFTRFGQAWVTPMFSSIYSFIDGLYSSVWGDALGSGSSRLLFRPQWDHDLANIGYVLALMPTLLFLAGAIKAGARVVRRPGPELLMLGAILSGFAFGLVYMSLRVPSYAQVKAFYALPALLPGCFIVVLGWEWLTERVGRLRPVLWLVIVTWGATVFVTFWIRSWDPYTQIARGISDADHGLHEQAARRFTRALELDPKSVYARVRLADSLDRMGRHSEAWQTLICRGDEPVDNPETLIQAAVSLSVEKRYPEAVNYLRQSIALAPDHPVAYAHLTTVMAWSCAPEELIDICREGLRVSPYSDHLHHQLALGYSSLGQDALALRHYRFAVLLNSDHTEALNNLAWILASSNGFRNGIEAVLCAERACALTSHKQALLLGTLAAAYAEAGRFTNAIVAAQQAVAQATIAGQSEIAKRNQELLELYRVGKAYPRNPRE
ncbi:MAG TPA: hypothetical protein VN673_05110 [Clostridia bacterium]|nr:hypothetical protein [Clostridia bacterium]